MIALINKHKEEFINYAFEYAPIPMAMLSLTGQWMGINRSFTQMTGYSFEELTKKTFYDLFHPDETFDDLEVRRRLLEGVQEFLVVERRLLNIEKQIIWVSITTSVAFDHEQNPQYYILQAQDITERKQNEWNLRTSEKHYRSLLDNSPDPISVFSDGVIVYANYATARMVGLSDPREIIGQNITPFLLEDSYEIVKNIIGEVVRTGKPIYDINVKLVKASGEVIDITVSCAPTTFQQQAAIQFTFRDNSILKTLEETLLHSQKRLRGIFNMAGVGIALMDLTTRKPIDCNPALETYLGYSKNEIINFTFAEVSHEDDIDQNAILFSKMANGEIDSYQIEKRYVRKDGKVVWGFLTVSILEEQSEFAIALIHDVTATKNMEQKLREANEKLTQLSYRDSLTSLHNRRYFDNALDRAWKKAKRTDKPLSLILFDIDSFKLYNDTYGHQSGDDCLYEIATAARSVLKEQNDVIARYGGEEFAIILPDTDSHVAAMIAERIRVSIEKLAIPHIANPTVPHVTISLGVATLNATKTISSEDLIHDADCALYKAKQGTKNCVAIFE